MIQVLDDHGNTHDFDGGQGASWETEDATNNLIVKTSDRVACFADGKWVAVIQERNG